MIRRLATLLVMLGSLLAGAGVAHAAASPAASPAAPHSAPPVAPVRGAPTVSATQSDVAALDGVDLEQAVGRYRDSDFAGALQAFAALAASEPDPGRRAVLHANAGTAAARDEQLGHAVWHLRAALADTPRDKVARRNLALVRARLERGASESDALSVTLRRLPLMVAADEVSSLCGLVGLAALLLLAAWRAGWLPRGFAWAAVIVALLDLSFLWASESARAAEAQRGVVLESVAVRGEPQPDGRVVLRLAPGTLVDVEDLRGDWTLLETESGGRGWVHARSVR